MSSTDYHEIVDYLSARDQVLSNLIAKVGYPKIERLAPDPFTAMVRNIVSQQLGSPAATTIYGRLLALLDNNISPAKICETPYVDLRSVGLSANKSNCIIELSQKAFDKLIHLDSEYLNKQSDEEIEKDLCRVKGIGPWTVQMLLMFQLGRLDVWPSSDLGVRKGYALAWEVEMPGAKQLAALGEKFKPYRSIVAWYCWRAIEIKGGFGPTDQTV